MPAGVREVIEREVHAQVYQEVSLLNKSWQGLPGSSKVRCGIYGIWLGRTDPPKRRAGAFVCTCRVHYCLARLIRPH